MASNRANLDTTPSNTVYLILGVLLLAMSILGFFLFRSLKTPDSTSTSTLLPTIVPDPSPTLEPEASESYNVSETSPTLPATPTTTKVEPANTPIPTEIPTPTPTILSLNSSEEGFSLEYPSYRKLYETTQSYGHRYTLFSSQGSITIHAGNDWSWSHPGREFTSDITVSGEPTFIYNAGNQTIIDLKVGDKHYTIQCVHNNRDSIKSECQSLQSSFNVQK